MEAAAWQSAATSGIDFYGVRLRTAHRREAAEIGRVPLNAIDKAIEQGVVKPRRKEGKPLLPAHELALLVLLRQIDVALPARAKERLRKW
ncbi:MAG TPA: hypothetical protein VED41_00265, partial [Solirubrobacteraceae bacterium]|nr:hypothetical protein [Solirubrobacteraceae bacterium]